MARAAVALLGTLVALWIALADPAYAAPPGEAPYSAAFVIVSGVAQEPPPPQPAGEQRRNALVALAAGIAIFCSSAALGIAFGIRRRIDSIAGPPDDEDDD
jgi:hypothetical protein